jgi:protein-tyrosine phosphatase
MGGYRTRDGRDIRWGTLFRSGTMANLDATGVEQIRRLGVAAIYDLRDNQERRRRPVKWHEGARVEYHSRDYELSTADLSALLRRTDIDSGAISELIHNAYRQLPFEQAASFRELFRLLLARRLPLLFACTAGKDRTGLAAALILYTLGAPCEVIEADYALTDLAIDELSAVLARDPRYGSLTTLDRAVYLPMLRADPRYLAIAFQEMARVAGSVDDYLQTALGVGPREMTELRAALLS